MKDYLADLAASNIPIALGYVTFMYGQLHRACKTVIARSYESESKESVHTLLES